MTLTTEVGTGSTPTVADLTPLEKGVRVTGNARIALDERLKGLYDGGASIRQLAAGMKTSYGFTLQTLMEARAQIRARGSHHRPGRDSRTAVSE